MPHTTPEHTIIGLDYGLVQTRTDSYGLVRTRTCWIPHINLSGHHHNHGIFDVANLYTRSYLAGGG